MYTDGSVDPGRHYAASVLHISKLNINNSWSLSKFTNILTSELYAINKALMVFAQSISPKELYLPTFSQP